MSRLQPGSLGKFIGKTGRVVTYKWRGRTCGRSAPSLSTRKPADDQLDGRQRFGRVTKFLRVMRDQIAVGWASGHRSKTAFNEAVSYHMENAVKGAYPDYQINFEKVLISRGRGIIDGGFQPILKTGDKGILELSWITCTSTSSITQPSDQLRIVILDPNCFGGFVSAFVYNNIAPRGALKATIELPYYCLDHLIHVYMFFVSKDGKLASRSEYLGNVTPH